MSNQITGLPFLEAAKRGEELIKETNATLFFKFTCEKCGSRQTFDKPNRLFTSGICEECKHETQLQNKTDIGYLAIFGVR